MSFDEIRSVAKACGPGDFETRRKVIEDVTAPWRGFFKDCFGFDEWAARKGVADIYDAAHGNPTEMEAE